MLDLTDPWPKVFFSVLPEKVHDEFDNIPDDPHFAVLLLLEPGKFLVSEGCGVFLFIPVIVLFHGNTLISVFCDQALSALT